MSVGLWQIVLIVAVFFLLFGGRRIPQLMRDLGIGIKSFRAVMKENDDDNGAGNNHNTDIAPKELSDAPITVAPKHSDENKG